MIMKELHLNSVLPPLSTFAPVLCAQKSFGNTLSHTVCTYSEAYNQLCILALPDPDTQLKCTHCFRQSSLSRSFHKCIKTQHKTLFVILHLLVQSIMQLTPVASASNSRITHFSPTAFMTGTAKYHHTKTPL